MQPYKKINCCKVILTYKLTKYILYAQIKLSNLKLTKQLKLLNKEGYKRMEEKLSKKDL